MDESDTRTHKRLHHVSQSKPLCEKIDTCFPERLFMYNTLHVIDKLSISELVDDLEKLALSHRFLRPNFILLFGWPCPARIIAVRAISNIPNLVLIVSHFECPSPFVLLHRCAMRVACLASYFNRANLQHPYSFRRKVGLHR